MSTAHHVYHLSTNNTKFLSEFPLKTSDDHTPYERSLIRFSYLPEINFEKTFSFIKIFRSILGTGLPCIKLDKIPSGLCVIFVQN